MPSGYGHWHGEDSGGASALPALVLVAAAAGLLFAAVEWVSAHAAGIEEVLYAIVAVGAVGGVAVVALVLHHEHLSGVRTGIDTRQLAALRADRAAAIAAPATERVSVPAPERQALEVHHHHGTEQHLHIHVGSAAEAQAVLAGRSNPQPEPLAIREKP